MTRPFQEPTLTNVFSDSRGHCSQDGHEQPHSQALLSTSERLGAFAIGSPENPLRTWGPGLRFGRLSPSDLSSRSLSSRSTDRTAQGLEDCCRGLIAQAEEAIVLTDSDGTIRIWNRGAERIFGYSPAEALGCAFSLLVPTRLRPAYWKGFRQMIDGGRVLSQGELFRMQTVRKHGGKVYVDLSFGLVRDGVDSVIGAFAIGRDCTARHLAEKAMVAELVRRTS